jgi:hypothetical protein
VTPLLPQPALGTSEGPPAAPFVPVSFDALLRRYPERAAAVLAAMRPAARDAQCRAHAAFIALPATRIAREWGELIARSGPLILSAVPLSRAFAHCASVYEPERLADLLAESPECAQTLLGQLSAAQQVTQAAAFAAWLGEHGMPVTLDEVLANWELADHTPV